MRDAARRFAGSPLGEIFAARAARVAFGLTLIAGAVLIFSTVYFHPRVAAAFLVLTLPLGFALAFLVGRSALAFAPWLLARERSFGAGPSVPVGALSSPDDSRRLRALAARVEPLSYSLPLVGLALVGPLSLHAPLFVLAQDGLLALGRWMAISAVLVGLAHITLAALSVRFARKLHRGTLTRSPEREALRAVGFTTLAACVPGFAWLGIPPIIVAITGLLFVPAAFAVIARCRGFERAVLAACGQDGA